MQRRLPGGATSAHGAASGDTEGRGVKCVYCRQPMVRWANPQLSTWGGEFQYVCFNDECPYFVRGWAWMQARFNVVASYRYRYDPTTGDQGPLPVWSREALRSGILPDSQESRHE